MRFTFVAASLGGLALLISASTIPMSAAGNSAAGLWTGRGQATRTADVGLASITCRYASEFWFTVADDGAAAGEATVSYDLTFNDAPLRTLIVVTHWTNNYVLSSIPGVTGLLTGALLTKDLVGMRMQYTEFAPARRARIGGWLREGHLHLQWADKVNPIPYQDYAVYPQKTQPSKAGTHPAYPPWIGDADIVEPLKGHLLATTSEKAAAYHQGDVTISAIWSATKHD